MMTTHPRMAMATVVAKMGMTITFYPCHMMHKGCMQEEHCHPISSEIRNPTVMSKVVQMGSCKDVWDSLKQFIDNVVIPECMVTDSATEFVGKNTDFACETRKMGIHLCYSEQGQPKQNHHGEHEIGILSTC
eukprot:14567333-Ditylum_brightwellii.AAC.1